MYEIRSMILNVLNFLDLTTNQKLDRLSNAHCINYFESVLLTSISPRAPASSAVSLSAALATSSSPSHPPCVNKDFYFYFLLFFKKIMGEYGDNIYQ